VPQRRNVIDLGQLPPADVPCLLNSLDLVIVYNRSSTFGNYCFPQKFYEALACDRPVVVARVGELALLLAEQPELFYEDGDAADLVNTIVSQLQRQERSKAAVPTWRDQAELLARLMQSAQSEMEQ
jgi:glycosyltransferase involved in cell wall biosynthesis